MKKEPQLSKITPKMKKVLIGRGFLMEEKFNYINNLEIFNYSLPTKKTLLLRPVPAYLPIYVKKYIRV